MTRSTLTLASIGLAFGLMAGPLMADVIRSWPVVASVVAGVIVFLGVYLRFT